MPYAPYLYERMSPVNLPSIKLPSPCFMGVGFVTAWITSSYSYSDAFHGQQFLLSNTAGQWTFAMVAALVTLVLCGIILRGGRARLVRPMLIPALLASVIVILFSLSGAVGESAEALSAAGAVLMGVGVGAMLVMWFDVLAGLDVEQLELAVPASAAIPLAWALAANFLPESAVLALYTLLPVGSGASLFLAYRHIGQTGCPDETGARGIRPVPQQAIAPQQATAPPIAPASHGALTTIGEVPVWVRALMPLFCIEFAGLWIEISTGSLLDGVQFPKAPDLGVLASIIFILLFVNHSHRVNLASLLRWSCPLIALALALCIREQVASYLGASVLCSIVETSAMFVVYIHFCTMAKSDRDRALFAFCVTFAVQIAGALVGNAVSLGYAGVIAPDIAIVCLMCALAFSLLPITGATDLERASGDIAGGAAGAVATETAEHITPHAQTECETAAERFGLSTRELDVLRLLAAGRSQPYIRERLGLSKSTVSTHVGHIYRKCGVTSRQELLDLLDTLPEPSGPAEHSRR